jgi:hypothetical protein
MTALDLKTRETSEGASLDADSFTSYSLNFEDVILHRLFPVNRTGFYVDVGAGIRVLRTTRFRSISGAGAASTSSRITAFMPRSWKRGLGTLISGLCYRIVLEPLSPTTN